MAYNVVTKSGEVFRATKVDHMPGFVVFRCWGLDIERRLPMSEVIEIYSTEIQDSRYFIGGLAVLFAVVFVGALIFF